MRIPGSLILAALTFSLTSWAADAPQTTIDAAPAVAAPKAGMKRFMIVRTFPPGALAGLDAEGKKNINKTNQESGARWVYSYANADKTRTYCIYEAPSEQAVRDAAKANKIPVDSIEEIPVVLTSR